MARLLTLRVKVIPELWRTRRVGSSSRATEAPNAVRQSRDLTQHIDDAIRDFAIHTHNVSTVRVSRHVWRASDCQNLMPQESIRVLVIVGDRNSQSLREDSDLGGLCKDWTESENSHILPVAQEGTDINNWLPQFISRLNASFWSKNDLFEGSR